MLTNSIKPATAGDAAEIAVLVGELLGEIMAVTRQQVFNFAYPETTSRLSSFLERELYFVFMGRDEHDQPAGFIALTECHALYADGVFGVIPELYVRPAFRSIGMGRALIDNAAAFGALRGWTRLEVTTPQLPQFDRTVAFYEREGFSITGGRKLKIAL